MATFNFGNQNSQGASASQGGYGSITSSNSHTHSETSYEEHSQGGSHSNSAGKQWASGEVDADVLAARQKLHEGYNYSNEVTAAKKRLEDTLNNRPGAFSSTYEQRLDDLYNQIMNRDKFDYNFLKDQMYQMYKDQYTREGRRAMQDTIGQASALTGGYSNSYAQAVGQQQYQNYLQYLNDIIPTLRDQKYQEYLQEGQDMYDKFGITQQAYNNEYQKYRDSMADWQEDRGFDYGLYSDERNFDYNKFLNDRNYYQQEYWNMRNAEQSNAQETNESNWAQTFGHSVTDETTSSISETAGSSWENAFTQNQSQSDSASMSLDEIMAQMGYEQAAAQTSSIGRSVSAPKATTKTNSARYAGGDRQNDRNNHRRQSGYVRD